MTCHATNHTRRIPNLAIFQYHMSITKPFPGVAAENQEGSCPFLGLPEDSQTSLAYPSSWNVCHHTKPTGTPNLDFQQSFCFSGNHINCPVYSRVGRAPLPTGIRFQAGKLPIQKRAFFPALVGGILLLLGIIGIMWGIQDSHKNGGNLLAKNDSYTPSLTELILPTNTIPFTDTPVPPTLTATPTISLTSTPTGPTVHPTDTLWPSLTRTRTLTPLPTRTATMLPTATATLLPTSTPSPAVSPLTPTITR